jgi:signal transduction histidine kinase
MFQNVWARGKVHQTTGQRVGCPEAPGGSGRTTEWLKALLTVAITPVALLIAIATGLTGPVPLTALVTLAASTQLVLVGGVLTRPGRPAAAETDRRADLLHEVRATVAGIVLSHRMLRAHCAELPRTDRDRLDQLHDAELGRLERLLVDDPERRVSTVDLIDVLTPVVDTLRLRGHDVHWPGTPACVLGRPDEVAEIVHVLLENAARHAPGRRVDIEVVRRGAWVDLRVSDRGPGVAPEVVSSLFERGTRGHRSPGSGIGLHAARRLSLGMEGRLKLDHSAPGTGATFVLTLPAGDTPDHHTAAAGSRPMSTRAC